jgi:hypothetical protein
VSDDERSGSCVICQTRDPLPDLVPCCGPCRSRLAGQLRDIPHLVEELKSPPEAEAAHDLVSVAFPAAAIAGQSNAPRVQGSREAPVPISVDRTDLLGEADGRTVHYSHMVPKVRVWFDPELPDKDGFVFGWHRELVRDEHGQVVMVPAGDQIGYPSAATVLDGWCALFAEERRESIPTPRPADQSRWLLDRLDELFKHPAVDECAKEIGDLWHVLRRACGLTMPQPELCIGVECKACDLRMLYRIPGSPYVECQCGQLYTEDEYRDWTKLLAAQAKRAHGEL